MSQPATMPPTLCLLDENVDVRLAKALKLHGLTVKRVLAGSSDQAVFAAARESHAILITNDKDFANTLLYPPNQVRGVVVFDVHPPSLSNLSSAVNRVFASLSILEFTGKLCIVSPESIMLSS